jgi:hypothetical protein
MQETFKFNKKKAKRDIIGTFFLNIFFAIGTYVLLFIGSDTESQILGYFFLACLIWCLVSFFRRISWLQTADRRYITVSESQIVRQWGDKIDSWPTKNYYCRASIIKTRDSGNLIRIDLVDKKTNENIFLTENDWIGEFSILVKSAIDKYANN